MLEFAAPEEVGLTPAGLDAVDRVVQERSTRGANGGRGRPCRAARPIVRRRLYGLKNMSPRPAAAR